MTEATQSLLQQVIAIAQRHAVTKLVLFGSRARGDCNDRSDFDIAVYGADNAALFDSEAEDIDSLCKLDIVHITANTSPQLLQNIDKDGVIVMDKLTTKRTNFASALARLREACSEYEHGHSTVVRDGVIQRFEFTCELAWKATREYLLDQGHTDLNSPKAVMKLAFSDGVITDELGWLELINARNTTSHVYDEQQADAIYMGIAKRFVGLFETLLVKLSQ